MQCRNNTKSSTHNKPSSMQLACWSFDGRRQRGPLELPAKLPGPIRPGIRPGLGLWGLSWSDIQHAFNAGGASLGAAGWRSVDGEGLSREP